MKIWEVLYIVHFYRLLEDNENSINWFIISNNKTIPIFIFYKFIHYLNFFFLTRHPEINNNIINNYPDKDWDWDYIKWKKDFKMDVDMQSRLDYYDIVDTYYSKKNFNGLETIDFNLEKMKFKLEYYVKFIQQIWRAILMNPHTKVGKKYLIKKFNKLKIQTSF